MKKFLIYISSILFLTFAIGMLTQYVSDNGLKDIPNSVYEDWDAILLGKINSKIIINGSSRGRFSYDTEVISSITKSSTHNLGFNAAGYELQQSKFLLYLDKNVFPKVIIQNIDLTHFNEDDVIPDESQFIPFVNKHEVNEFLIKYDKKYNYIGYIPLLKYNLNYKILKKGVFSNFCKEDSDLMFYAGFTPKKQKFKLDKHNIKRLDNYLKDPQRLIQKIDIKFEIVSAFYEDLLNSNKETILIYVWAPEKKERLVEKYQQLYNPLKEKLKIKASNNKNIYFLDFSNDIISQSDVFFYDTFHLNNIGAKEFSQKLSNEINKIVK